MKALYHTQGGQTYTYTVVQHGATFFLVDEDGVTVDEWIPLDGDPHPYLRANGYCVRD